MTFTWQAGRQLASLQKGTTGISYTYGSDGTRLTKTVNGVKTSYTWDGAQLVSQTTTGGDTLYFTYHGNSRVAVEYKGNTYYYIYNLQGDVVGLVNSSGTSVVSYTYDAWGNPESTTGSMASTLGAANPFRYRGYYYDTESGLYYLMSRYYDPVVGRWINADGYVSTGQGILSSNMYAYCENNPINRTDKTGTFWSELFNEIAKAFVNLAPAYAGLAGVAVSDGPLPFGDAIAIGGAVILSIAAIGYGVFQASKDSSISIPKVAEKDDSPKTVIYRYGGTNPGNLTPKEKDVTTGLSFSTVPRPGAAMTTIEDLNATGLVYAVKDGPTHVSVRPVGVSMEDWIYNGTTSIWTRAVRSVVVKWDGRS